MNYVIKAIMGTGILKILSLVLSFAASIILARSLNPEVLGTYTLIISIVGFASVPIASGLVHYTIRETSAYFSGSNWSLLRGFKDRLYQWVVLVTVLLTGVSFVLLDLLGLNLDISNESLIQICALMLLLLSLSTIRSSILRGIGKTTIAQLPELIIRPSIFLTVILLLWLNEAMSLMSVLIGQLSAYFTAFIVGALLISRFWPLEAKLIHKEYETEIWIKKFPYFIALIFLASLNKEMGILALGMFNSLEEVAFLRLAQNLGILIGVLLTIVNIAIAPDASKAFAEKDKEGLEMLFRQSRRMLIILTTVIGVILITYNKELIGFLFGNVYVETVSKPMIVIVFGHILASIFGPVFLFHVMSKYEKQALMASLIMVIVNVILQWLLVRDYGALGAAIAISTVMILWSFYLAVNLKKKLGIKLSIF